QVARGRQHGAVAADDDRKVRAAADLVVARHRAAVLADAGGGVALEHHLAAALAQEIAQRAQRLGDLRRLFPDERNALERWLHRTILTVESGHAGQARADSAEDADRAIHSRGAADRLADAVAPCRPGPVARHD